MEYMLCVWVDPKDLADHVAAAIKDGWRPQGGVSCAMTIGPEGDLFHEFCQAMVRRSDDQR